MKINKNDVDAVLEKAEKKIRTHRITNPKKFLYWKERSEHHIEEMNKHDINSNEFIENLHQGLLCEFEKNKYCIISLHEKALLFTLVKYHNSRHKEKLYFNDKGLRVKRYDRRAIRVDSFK